MNIYANEYESDSREYFDFHSQSPPHQKTIFFTPHKPSYIENVLRVLISRCVGFVVRERQFTR